MLRIFRVLQMVMVATPGFAGMATADETMTRLAVSGDWVALAHRPSMTAAADVCILGDAASGVGVRVGVEGISLRVMNKNWSLPTGVKGQIAVSVGNWNAAFDIDDNSHNMISAEIAPDVIVPMFTAMDKGTSMSLQIGKEKPLVVSLSGSTRATNAFRTCAGIEGNAESPGSNPFE